MPDGTVIRGVPDGVSKDELNTHLIEKYGQERFDSMAGATKAALSPQRDNLDPAPNPVVQATPLDDPLTAKELRSGRRPSVFGGALGIGTVQATPEELEQQEGEQMRRLVEIGIRKPEQYKVSQDEYDEIFKDRIAVEQQIKAEAADSGEPKPTAANEDAGWWRWAYEGVVTGVGKGVPKGLESISDMHARLKAQEISLGQLFLQRASEEETDLGEAAGKVVDAAAAKYGMDRGQYRKFVANTVDQLWDEERVSLQEFDDIRKEVARYKPEGAKEGIGYFGGLFVENINNLAYIGAGVASMNPITTMALMGTDVYARTYASARLDGRTANESSMDAFASTAIEVGTEFVPVSKLIALRKAGGKSATRKFLEGLGFEAGQEIIAEGMQIGYDIGVLDDDMTLGEAALRIRDAGIVGAMMGGAIAAPVSAFGDNDMQNAQQEVKDAADELSSIAKRIMNPDKSITRKEIDVARETYTSAVKARAKLVLAKEEAKLEKKRAKQDKKSEKRQKKMTPQQAARDKARVAAEREKQIIDGQPTRADLKRADVLERGIAADLGKEDAPVVKELIDAGLMVITKAGTPVVLPPGRRLLLAIRKAEKTPLSLPHPSAVDEKIEPVPFKRKPIDSQAGLPADQRDTTIKPTKVVLEKDRRVALKKRIDANVKSEAAQNKIVDQIIKAEEEAEMIDKRELELAAAREKTKDKDYDLAVQQLRKEELDEAEGLIAMDEKSVSGYKGTRLGDILRKAMKRLEKEEAKATEALKDSFWNSPVQGTLFDIGGAIYKGSKDYANLVRVGALKLAKTGLKYSAWSADMVGQFGESIKPVLAKVYHDAKKHASDIIRWSHERIGSGPRKGELRFAPKQFAKPGQIRRLRNTLVKLAKEGAAGRLWYEKSGKEILSITGGNKADARKFAGLLAIYSSQTGVAANLTNALKMWSIYHGNKKVPKKKQGTLAGRFSEQDRTAIEWLESDASDEHFVQSFGNKRFPFFQNLMREIDPANYEFGQGVTVDMWMMRVLGYDVPALSDAQYAFGTVEIKAIADKLGWEKQQVQAAVWVAIKARWEFIQKRAKDRAVKEGLAEWSAGPKGKPVFEVVGKDRSEQTENEKKVITLFRDEALKASVGELTKKLDESKRDFSDYLERHYATISWEAEPSTVLGLPHNAMSIEDKILMQYEISQVLTNPKTGREYLAEWLNLLGRDQFQGPGAWDGSVGAATQNKVLAPIKHGTSKDVIKQTQEEAAGALDGYSAILGYLLRQDGVAWHKPFYASSLKNANGLEIVRKTLTAKQTQRLYDSIMEVAAERNLDGTVWAPIIMDGAVRILNFTDVQNRTFHKLIAEAADRAKISGNIETFQSDGNLIGNDWLQYPLGEEYVDSINQNKNPSVQKAFARAQRELASGVQAIHDRWAKKYGGRKSQEVTFKRVVKGKKLGKVKKGFLRFRHFGNTETDVLDVSKAGTGIRGAERKRGAMPVISAYPDKGFTREEGLGSFEYAITVPEELMYNANTDPLLLKGAGPQLDMNAYEQAIKDAGYLGFYVPEAVGNLKGQARFFTDISASAVAPKFSIVDRPVVQITENSLDELEVRERNGEIYYTDDIDDAFATARRIHGSQATIEVVDADGDLITTDVFKSTDALALPQTNPLADIQVSMEEFYEEFLHETGPNPINPRERIFNNVAAIEIQQSQGALWIQSIRSFERGKQHGAEALKLVLELADLHGVQLKLTAKPFETGQEGLDAATLTLWYQRNGFHGVKGEPNTLVRYPKNAATKPKFALPKKPANRTNAGYGMEVEEVESYIEQFFGRFYGLTNFKVVAAIEELPDDLYAQITISGSGAVTQGLFYEDPLDGPTIFMIANNIRILDFKSPRYGEGDLKGMIEVVLHETIGHFGMRALLGEKGHIEMMTLIRRHFPKEVKAMSRRYGLENTGTEWRLAAEEVMAYKTAEVLDGRDFAKNSIGFVRKIVNIIRLKLAEMGLVKLTDKDIHRLILRAAQFVQNTSQAQLQKRALLVHQKIVVRERLERLAFNKHTDALEREWNATGFNKPKLSLGLQQERETDPDLDRFLNKISHGKTSRVDTIRDWWELRKGNMRRLLEIELLDRFAGIRHAEKIWES